MEKLYPFNNNKHYHFLVTNDKSLEKYYKWTAQEDDLLIAFKFNSNVWQKHMVNLLRHKEMSYVIERYIFLNCRFDNGLMDKLH